MVGTILLKGSAATVSKAVTKICTNVGSAVAAKKIITEVSKTDKPIDKYKDEKVKKKKSYDRVVRNSVISASVTLIGIAAELAIGEAIISK